MAATTYATVVSLLNTMDQIRSNSRFSTFYDNYQFECLHKMADFFLAFVENYLDAESEEADDLLSRIAAAAHQAEDVIEVEAADRVRSGSTTKSLTLLLSLQRVIKDMNYIEEKVVNFKEETGSFKNSVAHPPSSSTSAPLAAAKSTTMLGFNGHVEHLLDKLTGHDSSREIIPIVGMGGIGKTTLARIVYENAAILRHFDARVWVTVSQDFRVREVCLHAFSCLGLSTEDKDIASDQQLSVELHKALFRRRYLIILDDVWSLHVLDKIKLYLPENNNRSRIVVTTRQQELVDCFASSALAVGFLDDKNSWELFSEKTFPQEGFPAELEEIGKKIVEKCKGLPLAISVVGGLLRKSPRTLEYWEKIANDRSLVLEYSGEGNSALSILYLSYKHLPVWLRPCFLYLGLFPEDHQIDVSQLIKLIVAEGFIKSKTDQSLEDVGESYIKELVDRNLLLVGALRINKKLGHCYLHDLVREMCIRIAEQEKFYWVQRYMDGKHKFIVDKASASFYPSLYIKPRAPSLITPLVVNWEREEPYKSRLLRVLLNDKVSLPDPTSQQVNLRFLFSNMEYHCCRLRKEPFLSSLCWSLQTLILNKGWGLVLSPEMLKMQQLRHIEIPVMYFPEPPMGEDVVALHNLQTLKKVVDLIFTDEVCKRIPNIKELGIEYDYIEIIKESRRCFHLENLGCFEKLETLRYSCSMRYKYRIYDTFSNLKLPSSLKELQLRNCRLVESDMAMIASLPHLQILQLRGSAIAGVKWECVEEKFLCLKYLGNESCYDVYAVYDTLFIWTADGSCFPVLETLELVELISLKEIPSSIGEIPTLRKIRVQDCSDSVTMSAIKILEEQEDVGNEALQLRLDCREQKHVKRWREKIEAMGFTSQNVQVCHTGIWF